MGERASEGERVSEKVRERGERVCEKVRERLCVGENEMRISLFMDLSLNQVFLQATIFKSKISHRKVIQARTLKKKVNYHFALFASFQNFRETSKMDKLFDPKSKNSVLNLQKSFYS